MTSPASRQPPVASADQLKALAHPLRLRILRLCRAEDMTNKELADVLDVAPASVLRHVRELLRAGFLTAAPVRTGRRGALERPYRSTDAETTLTTDDLGRSDVSRQVQLAVVAAHHAELRVAPPDGVRSQERRTMRLSRDDLAALTREVEALIERYGARDTPDGTPVNLLWSLHDLA